MLRSRCWKQGLSSHHGTLRLSSGCQPGSPCVSVGGAVGRGGDPAPRLAVAGTGTMQPGQRRPGRAASALLIPSKLICWGQGSTRADKDKSKQQRRRRNAPFCGSGAGGRDGGCGDWVGQDCRGGLHLHGGCGGCESCTVPCPLAPRGHPASTGGDPPGGRGGCCCPPAAPHGGRGARGVIAGKAMDVRRSLECSAPGAVTDFCDLFPRWKWMFSGVFCPLPPVPRRR